MDRSKRVKQVFRKLPLQLARKVASFLEQREITGSSEFVHLVEHYPLPYLNIYFAIVPGEEAGLLKTKLPDLLERDSGIVLDITMEWLGLIYDWGILQVFMSAKNIEALAFYLPPPTIADVNRLAELTRATRNTAHIFWWVSTWEGLTSTAAHLEAGASLASLIMSDRALLSLDLTSSCLQLGCDVLVRCGLLQSLSSTESLCYLWLRDCGLDGEGAVLLATVLSDHKTIEYLDVGENSIGDQGVLALAQTLETNKKLRYLWLAAVDTAEVGGLALANALRKNNTLYLLFMKAEYLGPKCGAAFAAMLRV